MGVGYGKNGKKLYELRTAGPVGGFLNVKSAIRNYKFFLVLSSILRLYLCNCPRNEYIVIS